MIKSYPCARNSDNPSCELDVELIEMRILINRKDAIDRIDFLRLLTVLASC